MVDEVQDMKIQFEASDLPTYSASMGKYIVAYSCFLASSLNKLCWIKKKLMVCHSHRHCMTAVKINSWFLTDFWFILTINVVPFIFCCICPSCKIGLVTILFSWKRFCSTRVWIENILSGVFSCTQTWVVLSSVLLHFLLVLLEAFILSPWTAICDDQTISMCLYTI